MSEVPVMRGFLLQDEAGIPAVCQECLLPTEDPWKLPWLYESERYRCSRCKRDFKNPEE